MLFGHRAINGHESAPIASPETDPATGERGLHNDRVLPDKPGTSPVKPPPLPDCDL